MSPINIIRSNEGIKKIHAVKLNKKRIKRVKKKKDKSAGRVRKITRQKRYARGNYKKACVHLKCIET